MIPKKKKILCDNNNCFFSSSSVILLINSACFTFILLLTICPLVVSAMELDLFCFLSASDDVPILPKNSHNYYNTLLDFFVYMVESFYITLLANNALIVANVLYYSGVEV